MSLPRVGSLVQVGERAPEFELRDQNGGAVRLSGLRQKGPVAIFFYPKDDTTGCTKEACRYQMRNLCGRGGSMELQKKLDRALDSKLKAVKDDFLPAAEYVRRANVGHYVEVNAPVGHVRSPWGDWESTLT